MLSETEKKIIEKIYGDGENVSVVKDIVAVWNKKGEYIVPVIQDALVAELGFMKHNDDSDTVHKHILDDISIAFHKQLSFGFY